MARLGIVFPGQGSQYVGMGRELFQQFASARACFEEAQVVLGADISRLCFEGPREALDLTMNTQVATLTLEMAAWKVLEGQVALHSLAMAGHSLGEYGALCAAGGLTFAEALQIIQARAAYQQEAVPPGQGANAAIQGLNRDTVEAICRDVNAETGLVSPSCYNAPDQTVVSGYTAPVEKVMERARQSGAKRAVKLPLSAPFHCELLEGAARRLDDDFEKLTFRDCAIPVIPNCDPAARHSAATSRELLVRQIYRPVRWIETIEQMARMGADTVIEVGPKRVLSVLALRINKGLRVLNVENLESLQRTVDVLSGKS
ncbi:MAG TPA: ACP S-malonyltransferase [Syntrophales bacterium]|nr:ACP S-malonyltransferase [Syntrophales bacterium]